MGSSEPEVPASGYPKFNLSAMSEKDRAWLYLKTLYGMYESVPDADLLRYEFRSRIPIWRGTDTRAHNLEYFPLTEAGYDKGVDYIWRHRDNWDILNSILPRRDEHGTGRGLMSNSASPYFAVWSVDIDGIGVHGPAPGMTPLQGSGKHFDDARKAKGIPRPHMAVEGRNGYHLYWLLNKVYALDYEGGDWVYRQNLRRLGLWISGEPDALDKHNRPAYSGPHADTNQTFRAATLRPVGSYNHKTNTPRPIRLVHLDLGASPRVDRYEWTVNMLPPAPDPPIPDPDQQEVGRLDTIIGPHQRRPLTRRTRQFIQEGNPPGGGFHHLMRQGVSDLNHCNYTPEEAFGMLCKACNGPNQIEELRAFIFPQGGERLRFGEGEWNQTVVYPDDAIDRNETVDTIMRKVRGMRY